MNYLQRILTASVYDVAVESPLELAPKLSERLSNTVLLKREDAQPVFSFKLRGAYNKMARLTPEQRSRGVICASGGNHAQGVALSARRFGCRAVVVMPFTTPTLKSDAVRSLGAEVVLCGDSYTDAHAHALELCAVHGYAFVHPFDDPDVIAGQGTIAMEVLRQHQHPIDAVFVAVGGGGLIAGIAAYVKAVRPEIRIIGVQTTDSDAMLRSIKAGRRVQLDHVGLFCDGTAVKLVGEETFRLVREYVDDFVVVDTDAVCAAIQDVFEDTRSILEPAGAMSVAAVKQTVAQQGCTGKTLVAIASGANMNFGRLRFVADRSEVGAQREALFAVTIPEERGTFRRMCEIVGDRSVTEFSYRMAHEREAHVLVGIGIRHRGEAESIRARFVEHGFSAVDLVDDELSKEHIRYMVGGQSPLAGGERLYRFQLSERPDALVRFLSAMPESWNISLFHYRNQGVDYGRILVGLQVPEGGESELARFLHELGLPYVEETENPVYGWFLRSRPDASAVSPHPQAVRRSSMPDLGRGAGDR
jgi:threonine dehydratase